MHDKHSPAVDCCERAMPGIRGLAPYEPGRPISDIEREYGVSNIIKLASNESPLGPAPGALEAARAALDDIAMYPDGNAFALKQALAARHGVDAEYITLGNGSNDVLDLIARVFLGPGRNAVFSRHAFAVYPLVTVAAGAQVREAAPVAADGDMPYGHDTRAMAEAIDDKTGVVFIANPNNPTGTWLTADALRELFDRIPRHTVIVLDEAYCEYVDDARYPDGSSWLAQYPNLIVTRTFSKAWGLAGLRVGYSVCAPQIADLLNRVRQPFNVNLVAQAAALASLDDAAHMRRAVALNNSEREKLCAGLHALGLHYLPSAANFVCVQVPDSPRVYEALLHAGIIVRPVDGYGLPGFLRVTVGLPEHNQRLLAALEKVLA